MEIRYCSAETKNCMLDAYNGNGVDNIVHRRCLFEYVNEAFDTCIDSAVDELQT